ncbi:TonB-dependent siderophore receptor [Nostoc sp. PA-18-2419]|uniref:TonB-dependent siderophore receptor n=1 Tax=Nostoc sp. PA-18-2419 TaxID=2575443 RepID=UPI001108EFF3|nr:TonB-dependent siderophore receptor [Nostoc sp. PA-18-2419]
MRIERSPSNTWLWLVMIFLPLLMAQSVQAQVKQNQPTAINTGESFKATADSSTNRKIRRLSEIERPATDASRLLSQSSTPQAIPASAIVQVTGVKANSTDKGVEVILQTTKGQQLEVTNRSAGNNFIADIPNAQLRLPSGEAFIFRSEKPLAGITEITVTNFDANTIRVTAIGEASSPTVELFDSDEGLIFGLTTAASTAHQLPQTQPTPSQEQPANQTQPEEPIELVVTGEQDGYRVPDASTATRTDTPIRDIPASIQVIPRQVLKDQQITQVREAVSNVSGITAGPGGSQTTFGESFILRGFADSSDSSTFVDGFNRNNILSRSLDLANIEQLEVLKGPASVLYGLGDPGGIINIVTKQPLATPYYAVEGTIGNFDFYRPTLDLSGPLNIDKTIRYRLNMAYENSGSFVDFVKTKQAFIAPVISFDLGKNTTLVLEGEYLNTSKVEYIGIPALGSLLPNPLGRVPRSRFVDDPDLKLERDFIGLGYRLQHKFSDNWSIRNAFRAELEDYDEAFAYNLGLRVDNRTIDRNARFDQAKSRNYNVQTDVIGKIQTGIVKQDLLFGLELSRTDFTRKIFNPTPNLPPIDFFNPNYDRPAIQFDTKAYDEKSPQNFIGVYTQDLISIGDKLKVLLGGRFDFVESSYEETVNAISRDQQDTAFSPRIGIVYQPIQPVSLYASYSRSFQPSPAFSRNADDTTFEPTKGESFEVGVKSDFFDGKLSATLAAYQITKQNIIVNDPANPGFSLQVGEQRSRGIELDVAGEILPGWKIIANYAYIDPEITEDTNPEYKGNEPSNVARNSASLWTTYELQTGGWKGLGFGGGVTFVGDRQGDLENTFTLPSYVRTDAALYYRRDNWRVGLNIKNLFDVYYFESADSLDSVYPAAPFTVLGTVSVQF